MQAPEIVCFAYSIVYMLYWRYWRILEKIVERLKVAFVRLTFNKSVALRNTEPVTTSSIE